MTQIALLSEAEIEERYHVTGARPVAFMLAGFVRDGDSFTVQLEGDFFPTKLLAVLPEKGQLIFDCSGSPETNRRLLQSKDNVFIGRPGGIHVQFSTGAAVEVVHERAAAFAAPLPKFLVRLQRRESFRAQTPLTRPLQFFGRLPDGKLLNLPTHDISVTGIGLSASELPEDLTIGMVLPNCHFALPEETQELFCSATICNLSERKSRSGGLQWHVGLRFNDLPPAAENRIQRYIDKLERERRERS
ncbi:flagellar brake protein [Dechloromonas denitrificans]|uniref:flagellar brake protein n=1 Tax=Dechloromonas denitrificans TaxID=281362 RepID=UPI001CFACF29|nr:flagellar brake protein [Dechloromonas denitrificans]UCV09073.1 flagellar brake protein [Dechloromonas denitrificans]